MARDEYVIDNIYLPTFIRIRCNHIYHYHHPCLSRQHGYTADLYDITYRLYRDRTCTVSILHRGKKNEIIKGL
jgi:hypothetical protein